MYLIRLLSGVLTVFKKVIERRLNSIYEGYSEPVLRVFSKISQRWS